MRIRRAVADDREPCYAIAVATGDAGRPAGHLYRYPDLVGEVYTGPYLALEPEHCFVLADDDDRPCGYAIGTPDTRAFEEQARERWWPTARTRFADIVDPTPADRALLTAIDAPAAAPDALVPTYPAHGHIDLLPTAQGHGWGRTLMERLLTSLAGAGATGIHLGVDPANTGALGFYDRLGFRTVRTEPGVVYLGRTLTA